MLPEEGVRNVFQICTATCTRAPRSPELLQFKHWHSLVVTIVLYLPADVQDRLQLSSGVLPEGHRCLQVLWTAGSVIVTTQPFTVQTFCYHTHTLMKTWSYMFMKRKIKVDSLVEGEQFKPYRGQKIRDMIILPWFCTNYDISQLLWWQQMVLHISVNTDLFRMSFTLSVCVCSKSWCVHTLHVKTCCFTLCVFVSGDRWDYRLTAVGRPFWDPDISHRSEH